MIMNEDVKNCPYCGEVILASAKKCKHCGEWLDKNFAKTRKKPPKKVDNKQTIVHVHNTVQQSNEQSQTVFVAPSSEDSYLLVEIFIVSAFFGYYLSSWWVFLGFLVSMIAMLFIPILDTILCFALAFFMGLFGWSIGKLIGSDGASWVIGIIVGIGTLFVNLQEKNEY